MKVVTNAVLAISMIVTITSLTVATSSNSPFSAQAQVKNRQLTVKKGSNARKNTRTLEDVSRNSRGNRADDWHTRGLRRKGHGKTSNRKRKFHKPSYQRYHKHTGKHPVR